MLYLLGDKVTGTQGLKYAQMDPEAVVVLIKDGVYLDMGAMQGKKVYAMDDDVRKRGMAERLEAHAEMIGYDQLVDLMVEHKVANFA